MFAVRLSPGSLGVQYNFNSVLPRILRHFFRDVAILSCEQLAAILNDCNAASKAPEHLPEFQPDISSTENQ